MKLTETQKRALRLTQRGCETIIIDHLELDYQPTDIRAAALELPGLAKIGLMSREDLSDTRIMYRITDAGRSALSEANHEEGR